MPFRLARHVEHDEASRQFPAETAPLQSVKWEHAGPVLDQGQLGSCTGNAASDALNTKPLWDGKRRLLTEQDAVAIYSWATHHDGFPGVYPPDDTGSSGLAVCKALKKLGLIRAYRHAFGLQHTLGALAKQPVIIGIPWTDDMFTPDADGFIRPTGQVAGGHEVCLIELDVENQSVTLLNSWGSTWGQDGTAKLTWDDLGALLAQQGDCTVPLA